jgi:outer membrane protein assembly factor BamB
MIPYKTWAIFLIPLLVVSSLFGNWPNWRGPNFDGSAVEGFKYPIDFSPNKGVRWIYDLDGPSASTPIIMNNRVFLSGVNLAVGESDRPALLSICLHKKTGKLLWSKSVGSGYQPGNKDGNYLQLDSRSNYSSPSPVASGSKVVFFYGNGDLVCFDHEGDLQWRRNIQIEFGDFCFQWTFSASPTIYNGRLFLPVLQRDEQVHGRGNESAESYLLCLNLNTGKTIWRHVRATQAKKESREAFSTIIPYKDSLLVAGGDFLTSHDPQDGSELWRWGTWNNGHKQEWWRLVPSPVVGAGRVLVCAPKKAPVFAVSIPREKSEAKLVWATTNSKEITSDVPTPLFFRGYFYVLSDLRQNISKLDPENGTVAWILKLPGKYKWRASPTAADRKIYLMNHNAEVLVVSSESGEILHSVKMGEAYDDQTRSSVALSSGQLFIRTNKKLYCIE